jgi:hypothetical protein
VADTGHRILQRHLVGCLAMPCHKLAPMPVAGAMLQGFSWSQSQVTVGPVFGSTTVARWWE